VLVHGFTQTGACWGPIAAELAQRHEVVLVDAPGHGHSAVVSADLDTTASLLAELGPARYVGYSMGGRMSLHLAVAQPAMIEQLVLVGTTPGIEDDDERALRRDGDRRLAERIARVGVDTFVTEWLQQPMFAGLPPDPDCLTARRSNTVEGLVSSLELCGTGRQQPLWGRLEGLRIPTLLVTGADDAKYTRTAARMAGLIGANARRVVIAGAGHAAHLERPDVFTRAVSDFFEADAST
jgi:2-succinyl-6-hydroxy-2,4-cyclohexadiene-1-carboxylate synthase